MVQTITISSTPAKLKRTGSIMLSPSKRNKFDQAGNPPTHMDIFSWTLTPDAVAPCHIRDIPSLKERKTPGGRAEPTQINKHAAADFYWLGRVPCRNVRIVGLLVGVSQYDQRITYIVDDGTGVIECSYRAQPLKRVSEQGNAPLASAYPPPPASVGDVVRISGAASKMKSGDWQIKISHIDRCPSRNDELTHYLDVSKLHATHYSLSEPFLISSSSAEVEPRTPLTPTRKIAPVGPSSNYTAQSSPFTEIASSPVRSEHVPATPTKLRHPSRLHHVELTRNTFRIYLKYFMDQGPTNKDDPFDPSFTEDSSTPTKYGDPTPRPSRFSATTSRPKIDPLDFGKFTCSSSSSLKPTTTHKIRGYTISYLRRIPELALLAGRVAKQEIRLARKQAKEKEKAATSKCSSKTTSATLSNARQPTSKDVKRLFVRAVNELFREGSIAIWDCPSYSCRDAAPDDSSFLWKTMTSNGSMASSANTTALSSVFAQPVSGPVGDGDGDISDPDPNEDVYVPIKPNFLATRLEELIPIVQDQEKRRQPKNVQPYRGASSEGLLRCLRGDDRLSFVHIDSVEEALKYLEEDGRAWMSVRGQWQLTV